MSVNRVLVIPVPAGSIVSAGARMMAMAAGRGRRVMLVAALPVISVLVFVLVLSAAIAVTFAVFTFLIAVDGGMRWAGRPDRDGRVFALLVA